MFPRPSHGGHGQGIQHWHLQNQANAALLRYPQPQDPQPSTMRGVVAPSFAAVTTSVGAPSFPAPSYPLPENPILAQIARVPTKTTHSTVVTPTRAASTMLGRIELPTDRDVLLGRGLATSNHPGNIRFRNFVHSKKELYKGSSKVQKTLIGRSIVAAMRFSDPPTRFLEKDLQTGLWYTISDEKAKEKVSQKLRDKEEDASERRGAAYSNESSYISVRDLYGHNKKLPAESSEERKLDIEPGDYDSLNTLFYAYLALNDLQKRNMLLRYDSRTNMKVPPEKESGKVTQLPTDRASCEQDKDEDAKIHDKSKMHAKYRSKSTTEKRPAKFRLPVSNHTFASRKAKGKRRAQNDRILLKKLDVKPLPCRQRAFGDSSLDGHRLLGSQNETSPQMLTTRQIDELLPRLIAARAALTQEAINRHLDSAAGVSLWPALPRGDPSLFITGNDEMNALLPWHERPSPLSGVQQDDLVRALRMHDVSQMETRINAELAASLSPRLPCVDALLPPQPRPNYSYESLAQVLPGMLQSPSLGHQESLFPPQESVPIGPSYRLASLNRDQLVQEVIKHLANRH